MLIFIASDRISGCVTVQEMILISGDAESAAAMTYARGLGYHNTYFLKGEWMNG
jgi:hypothetical protein